MSFFFPCKEKSVSPAWLNNFTALKRNPLPVLPASGITGLQIRGLKIRNQFPGYLHHGLKILLWSGLHGLLVLKFSDAESKASSLQAPAIFFNPFFFFFLLRCIFHDAAEEMQPRCGRTQRWLWGTDGSFYRPTSQHTISNGPTGLPENTVASNLYSRKDHVKLLFIM